MTRVIPPQSVAEYFSKPSKSIGLKKIHLANEQYSSTSNQNINLVINHENQLEINLSALKINAKNSPNALYFRGQPIGTLLLNDNLRISIKNEQHSVKIIGSVSILNCIIDSSGDVIVASAIKAKKLLQIHSKQLHVLQPIVDCEQVFLHAEENAAIAASIHSQNCEITATNLILAANIYTKILKVKAFNHLDIKKKVRGEFTLALKAKTMSIIGSLSGDKITINGHHKVENSGTIIATEELDITVPDLVGSGRIRSKGKLKIKSESTTLAKTAVIDSGIEFKFTGAKLDSHGHFKLTGAAFFSAGDFTHSGDFIFPQEVYLHAQKLVVNSGNFGWFATDIHQSTSNYGKPLIRVIRVDETSHFASDTTVGIQASQFFTPQLNMYGNFHMDSSFIKTRNILFSKQAIINSSDIEAEEKITASSGGQLDITKSVLRSNKFNTDAKSELTTHDSKLFANFIQTNSSIKLFNTSLVGRYITQSGHSSMSENTRVIASKAFRQSPKAKSHFDHASLQTPDAFIAGDLIADNETALAVDNLDIAGELHLSASGVRSNKIYTHKTAKISGQGSVWTSASILINGQSKFIDDKFEVKHFSNTGNAVVNKSHIISENAVLSSGSFEADTTTLKSEQLNLSGTYKIIDGVIQATHVDSTASGSLIATKLKSTFLDIEAKNKTEIKKSQLVVDHVDFKADVSMQDTIIASDTIFHSQGQWTVSDKSQLLVRSALATAKNSNLVMASKSLINGVDDKAKNFSVGYFGGSVDTDDVNILLQQLSFAGNDLNLKNSNIEVRQHINLFSQQQNLKHVGVTARNMMIAGDLKMHDNTQIKADALQVLPNSKVDCDLVKLDIKNDIDIHGVVTAQKSEMHAHHLNVYKQLKMQQKSKLFLKGKLEAYVPSTLSTIDTEIKSHDIKIYGTSYAEKSKWTAQNSMTIAYGGNLTTNEVELDIKNKIFVANSGRIDGTKLNVKAKTFDNAGAVIVDGLNIDVDVLNNCGGYINGGKALKINANLALLNLLGRITSNNTTINTGVNLNFLGDICGSDNLAINSLVNLNVLGAIRSYNASVNSLLNFNFGLVMPALPSSADAVFSTQHLLSFSKMLLSNIIPSASNTINLAFQLAPMAWSLGNNIYSIATSKDKKWEDLLPIKLDGGAKSWSLAKDIIPAVLSVKNILVTSNNLSSTLVGAQGEWQTFNWDKVQQDFSSLSPSSFVGFAATAFGPTLTQESVGNFNGGLNTSLNVTQSDWASLNSGINIGAQSITHNTHTMLNRGVVLGAQTNLTGKRITNSGAVIGVNKMYMHFAYMYNEVNGYTYGSNGKVLIEHLRNKGDMKFDDKSHLEFDIFENDINGELALTGDSKFQANHFTEAGFSRFENSQLIVKKELKVEQTGDTAAKNSTTQIGNLTVAGKAAFRKDIPQPSDTPANSETNNNQPAAVDLKIDKKIDVKETGELILEGVTATAESVNVAGYQSLIHANLDVIQKVTTAATGNLILQQSSAKAAEVDNHGHTQAADNSRLQTEYLHNQQTGDIKVSKQSTLQATNYQEAGHTKINDSKLIVKETLNINKTGDIAAHDSITQLGHLTVSGVAAFRKDLPPPPPDAPANPVTNQNSPGVPQDVDLKVDHKIDVKDGGTLILEGVTTQAQSFDEAGKLVLKHAQVSVNGAVNITTSAIVTAKDSQISGNKITHAGTVDYQGYLGLKATTDITTTKASHIQTEQKDAKSILQLEAHSANLNGEVKAENAIVDVAHLSEAHTLVTRTGKYTDFHVSNALDLRTDADLRLEQPINRNCGLSITGRSVYMGADYKTNHDVVLKSTVGDVSLYSNLQANNIFVDSASHLYTTRNIHGQQVVQFTANQDYINLGGHVQGDVVSCKAATIKNYHFQSHELDQLPAPLKKLMGQAGSLYGRQVYLEATQGNIENHGGVIRGTQYLQAIARGSIINQCSIKNQKGKHDIIKTFMPAVMAGGTGLDNENTGLYLSADGKVINNGSILSSEANNFIHAKQGLECIGQSHTYISHHKVKRKWYGSKKEKTETATTVQTADIIAKKGRNIIICDNGGIHGVAAQFISRDGTQAFAEGDIKLYSLKYQDKSVTKKQELWGVHKSKKKEKHEQAVPTLIYDNGITRLESAHGNIIGRGVVALGNGAFQTIASDGSVLFSADKLSHSSQQKSSGFSISSPALQQIDRLLDSKDIFSNVDPMVGKVDTLLHSENATEWGANSWNTAVVGYNSYQMFSNAWNQDSMNQLLLQRSGINGMLTPAVNLTYGTSTQNSDWETVGPGCIQRSSWDIEAANRVLLEGITVDIAGDMRVKAKTLDMHGHELHSSTSMRQQSATVGVGMTGVESASVSHAKSKTTSTQHANQQTKVGGNLHVEVEDWNLKSANVDAGTLTGNVSHVLHLQSQQDQSRTKSEQASLSTTGQVALAQSKDEVIRVQQATGIHVREGINHDANHQFNVNTTVNEGAKITSDGKNNFHSETIINKEVKDFEKHSSQGIGFNVHQMAKSIQPAGDAAPSASYASQVDESSNAKPAKMIDVATVTQTKHDFAAVQHATYHGQEGTNINAAQIVGNMNTQNNNGYVVLKDSKQNITVDIPLVDLKQRLPQKPKSMSANPEVLPAKPVEKILLAATEPSSTVDVVVIETTATAAAEIAPALVENNGGQNNVAETDTKSMLLPGLVGPQQKYEYSLAARADDAAGFMLSIGNELIDRNLPGMVGVGFIKTTIGMPLHALGIGINYWNESEQGNPQAGRDAVIKYSVGVATDMAVGYSLGILNFALQPYLIAGRYCAHDFAQDDGLLKPIYNLQQEVMFNPPPQEASIWDQIFYYQLRHDLNEAVLPLTGAANAAQIHDNTKVKIQDAVIESIFESSSSTPKPHFKYSDAMRQSFFAPPPTVVAAPKTTTNVNTNLTPQPK